jgi:hypothetical protein
MPEKQQKRTQALGMEIIAVGPYISADDRCWQDTKKEKAK